MVDTAEKVIALLFPVIVESIDSLNTLNLLARTSKSLQIAVRDARSVDCIATNMPAASRTVLRKLFVLPAKVSLSCMMLPCPRRMWRFVPRCSVLEAFKRAIVVHGDVASMSRAFHSRQRRSTAMKLVWKKKKNEIHERLYRRRCDLEQIHQDLFIIPSYGHVTTDSEFYYMTYGVVKRMCTVYRDKRKSPVGCFTVNPSPCTNKPSTPNQVSWRYTTPACCMGWTTPF